MPAFETLTVEVRDGVGTVVLDRPDRLNAISAAMVEELTGAAAWLQEQPDVRAVVLRGAGRCFSAGADLDEFRDRYAADAGGRFRELTEAEARRGAEMTDAWSGLSAVTVAAVHGVAMGGAVALLAACDLRLVSDDARIVVPEVGMGLPLAWGAVERLVRELGPGVARGLLLAGRPMSGPEAVARGFALASHPADRVADEASALAARLAGQPAYALRVLRTRIDAVATRTPLDDDARALAAALEDDEVLAAGRTYLASLGDRPRPAPRP